MPRTRVTVTAQNDHKSLKLCFMFSEVFIQIYLPTGHRHKVTGRHTHLYFSNPLPLSLSW